MSYCKVTSYGWKQNKQTKKKIKILSCNGWLNPEELINSSGADRETEVVTGALAKPINL